MGKRRGLKPWESFTAQEQTFVNEYMRNGHNAVRAYQTAGYYWSPSMGANRVESHKLRHKTHIAAEIAARMDTLLMSEQEALVRQSEAARFDIGDLLKCEEVTCPECGAVIHGSEEWRIDVKKALDTGATQFIKKMSYDRAGRLIIEFRDVDKAQDTMLRARGAFRNKKEEKVLDSMAALLNAARSNQVKALTPGVDADFEVVEQRQLEDARK